MTRWVDVRVHVEDSGDARQAILAAFAPVDLAIELNPPSAGREIEISIGGHSEQEVLAVLHASNVAVYAHRTRLAPPR